jgi:hypothetical protein
MGTNKEAVQAVTIRSDGGISISNLGNFTLDDQRRKGV